jgi:hypothetical protein
MQNSLQFCDNSDKIDLLIDIKKSNQDIKEYLRYKIKNKKL